MESKKDIGKLFRDNLDQLEYTPSAKVWDQIKLDLKEKKKKRRFFIWFFLASIVTSGLLLVLAYQLFNEKPSDNKNDGSVSVGEKGKIENTKSGMHPDEKIATSHSKQSTESASSESTIAHQNNESETIRHRQINSKKKTNLNSVLATAAFQNKNATKKRNAKKWNRAYRVSPANSNPTIAESQTNSALASNSQTKGNSNSSSINNETKPSVDSLIAATNKKAEKKNRKPKDSLAVKDSVVEIEKPKAYEIVIAPYYGFNYGGYFGSFNTISNNPTLDEKAEMRSTYGLLLRWMFSNRLGIQTGAGKINSRYLSTVQKTGDTFINTQNVATDRPIAELEGQFANEAKVKFTFDSSYLEIPLEAYYVVRDKKIGVAASLGVSVLFSGKNSIFAESEHVEKMKIGNLKSDSASGITTNAKLYLFYKITPALHFDLYPAFQYQIMSNQETSGYFFSVRTGLSYKF